MTISETIRQLQGHFHAWLDTEDETEEQPLLIKMRLLAFRLITQLENHIEPHE